MIDNKKIEIIDISLQPFNCPKYSNRTDCDVNQLIWKFAEGNETKIKFSPDDFPFKELKYNLENTSYYLLSGLTIYLKFNDNTFDEFNLIGKWPDDQLESRNYTFTVDELTHYFVFS